MNPGTIDAEYEAYVYELPHKYGRIRAYEKHDCIFAFARLSWIIFLLPRPPAIFVYRNPRISGEVCAAVVPIGYGVALSP